MDPKTRRDIFWWRVYLPQYNGVSMLWPDIDDSVQGMMASDASLTGLGGTLQGKEYFRLRLPEHWRGVNIAYLEILAVVVCLKVWGAEIKGKRVLMLCDNEAVVSVLGTGKARDRFLQAAMREVVYLLALAEAELRVQYVRSSSNKLPDYLSRWYQSTEVRRKFHGVIRDGSWKRRKPGVKSLEFVHDW